MNKEEHLKNDNTSYLSESEIAEIDERMERYEQASFTDDVNRFWDFVGWILIWWFIFDLFK